MHHRLEPETLDLAELANFLRETCAEPLLGPIEGRTRVRDELIHKLDCSLLEAEQVVETMIGRGFIVLRGEAAGDLALAIVIAPSR